MNQLNPFGPRKRTREDASPKTPRKSFSLNNVTRTDENKLKEAITSGVTSFRGVIKEPTRRPNLSKSTSFSTYNPVVSYSNDASSLLFSPPKKETLSGMVPNPSSNPPATPFSLFDTSSLSCKDATTIQPTIQNNAKEPRKKLVLMSLHPLGKIHMHKPGVKVQKAAAVAMPELVSEKAPLDWNLVTTCILVTKRPFEGLGPPNAITEARLVENACMRQLSTQARAHLSSWSFTRLTSPNQEQVLKRVFSKKTEHLDNEENMELQFWNQCEEDYLQALRGAYNALRHQARTTDESYFYCVNAEFGVIVRRIGESDGTGLLEAFITKTSPGLREVLRGRSIDGEMIPLSKGHVRQTLSMEKMPPKHVFALHITEKRSMNALVEFLASWKDPQPTRRASYGTARIFAPWPFNNASIGFAKVEDKGLITKTVDEETTKLHRIEIRGPLLPTQLQKLMGYADELELQVTEVEPTTRGSNLLPSCDLWPSCMLDERHAKFIIKDTSQSSGKWTIKL
jgi:hypothetical protein